MQGLELLTAHVAVLLLLLLAVFYYITISLDITVITIIIKVAGNAQVPHICCVGARTEWTLCSDQLSLM